jgi:hypothetical protein
MKATGRATARAAGTIGAILIATASVAAAQTVRPGEIKAGVDAWERGDYQNAVTRWRPAAVAGDPDAQFNLGQAYKLGRGVPVDLALAESWFGKAAQQGHLQAQDNYGLALYTAGRKSEAAPWLEKSVARGEARGQLVLGTMLFNGDGVARNYPRAYALMTMASQKGLKSASETLAQMDQYITPADRQQALRLVAGTPAPATAVASKPQRTAPKPAVMARAAAPAAAKPAAARTAPSSTGSWRIQLGAFSQQGNAEALWGRLRGQLAGAKPSYVKVGAVTRLQAGGYASRVEAQRACTAARSSCVVVAP